MIILIKVLVGILIGAPIGYITCCLMIVAGEGDNEEAIENESDEEGGRKA